MKKVLCTLLMAAFISPLWAAETEAAPEQKLMPAITADMEGNEFGVVNDILRAASGKDSPFDHDNGRGNDDKWSQPSCHRLTRDRMSVPYQYPLLPLYHSLLHTRYPLILPENFPWYRSYQKRYHAWIRSVPLSLPLTLPWRQKIVRISTQFVTTVFPSSSSTSFSKDVSGTPMDSPICSILMLSSIA